MKSNSFDKHDELLKAAREAIEVSERLMDEYNEQIGEDAAPGPLWAPALNRLKQAVAQYDSVN